MAQHPGHEPGADVLEGEGGAMEELQGEDAGLHFPQRAVEGKGLPHDPVQVAGRDVFREKGVRHAAGDVRERARADGLEEPIGQPGDALRHIEPAVLREAPDDGLPEAGERRFPACAIVSHWPAALYLCS